MSRFRSDRGAAAVEFALVVVPLILMLAGIIDFGHAYSQQLALSSGARDIVRAAAVHNTAGVTSAKADLQAAVPGAVVDVSPTTSCTTGQTVTVTARYPLDSLTGLFDPLFSGKTLTGEGVMKCGG